MAVIIAAIDFSPDAEKVMKYAIAQAEAFDATLYIIHVVAPSPDFVGYDVGPSVVRDQIAEHYVEQHKDLQKMRFAAEGLGIRVKALLLQGPTVKVLLSQVEKLESSLLVVGSHGTRGIRELILGSTTAGLIRAVGVPVLLVPV